MKRWAALLVYVLIVILAQGCSPKASALPSRTETLPDSFVNDLAGGLMRFTWEKTDAQGGYAGWAWEESEGMPKMLFVEMWNSVAAFDTLYGQAMAAAEPMDAPEGAKAGKDGRAAYLKAGGLCFRVAVIGMPEEEDALGMLVGKLAYEAMPAR